MPRDIPVSNGQILIAFDKNYQIRDLYYPHVGQENHAVGYEFKFGIWVDNEFSWISDDSWEKSLKYKKDSLITDVWLINHKKKLKIHCQDCVDIYSNKYIRQLEVINLADYDREVRVFFHHDFRIYGTEIGDTGFYQPVWKSVIHYKQERYFACGLSGGVEHYSIGAKALNDAEGTWKDAEDGHLQNTVITHGSVDSTIAKHVFLKANSSEKFNYWICIGKSLNEVEKLHFQLINEDIDLLKYKTEKYWELWVNQSQFFGMENCTDIPSWIHELYKRSLLIISTQIDHAGAILAANDSDIQFVYKDHYSYLWPRDGIMIAYALDLAGCEEYTQRFYELMNRIIDPQGFYLHKYDSRGALASSWHPWIRNGQAQLPIQEDETALVLWGLWEHFQINHKVEFINKLYHSLILPAADFLVEYRDVKTYLPLPSFDLWEERRGIMTYTACTVEAGLRAASKFAHAFGDEGKAELYECAANEVKTAIEKYLYSPEHNRFLRGLVHPDDHTYDLCPDSTIDSSLSALFRFGTFDVNDIRVVSTMQAYRDELKVNTDVGGMARYKEDWYHHVKPPNEQVTGNPWIISTIGLMVEDIMKANTLEELQESLKYLEWVNKYALASGVLSEQLDPYTGEQLSVSPLTWSHATVVECILLYIQKYKSLKCLI